jgi:hypothetical protein
MISNSILIVYKACGSKFYDLVLSSYHHLPIIISLASSIVILKSSSQNESFVVELR